jgi:hypothetical protein
MTHGHPLATFAAVECVLALISILKPEERVPESLSDPGAHCRNSLRDPIARYDQYVASRHEELDTLHPTTGLWMWRQVFERCLDLHEGSSWSNLPSFEEGVLKSVNESFDRDTAGAVAGALLGLYRGETGISKHWVEAVEKRDEILSLADQFLEVCSTAARN